jgi:hypothetical protein
MFGKGRVSGKMSSAAIGIEESFFGEGCGDKTEGMV